MPVRSCQLDWTSTLGPNLAKHSKLHGALLARTNRTSGPARDKLNATFLLATLNPKRGGGEFSHTEVLSELVAECLREYNVASQIVRLVEYEIAPGTKSNMGKGDE